MAMTQSNFRKLVLTACLAVVASTMAAADSHTITIASPKSPITEGYKMGEARSPDGTTLTVDSSSFLLNGKPWTPVMGEFHFSRYPENEWREELLKMKAGGIDIISTYVFWIHHEEIEGQFDWSGQRDLRHFVELAGKHGMLVWVRVGPWDHGEVRNGGLPDWVLAHTKIRQNDPAYLKYVQRFFGEIGR